MPANSVGATNQTVLFATCIRFRFLTPPSQIYSFSSFTWNILSTFSSMRNNHCFLWVSCDPIAFYQALFTRVYISIHCYKFLKKKLYGVEKWWRSRNEVFFWADSRELLEIFCHPHFALVLCHGSSNFSSTWDVALIAWRAIASS